MNIYLRLLGDLALAETFPLITTKHTDLSDSLCEVTLRTIMKNARILNGDLNDYNAWAEIVFPATSPTTTCWA